MAKNQGGDATRPSRRRDDDTAGSNATRSGGGVAFMPGDIDAMDSWGRNGYSSLRLSDDEIDSLTDYQGKGYSSLNKKLREDKKITGKQTRNVKDIDNVLNRSRTPSEVSVFRGIGKNLDSNLGIGSIIKDKAYSSTSLNLDVAENFSSNQTIARIRVPRGSKGVYMDAVIGKAGYEGEQELLLGRGARFVVTGRSTETVVRYGVSRTFTFVDMDLIDTD